MLNIYSWYFWPVLSSFALVDVVVFVVVVVVFVVVVVVFVACLLFAFPYKQPSSIH